MPLAEGIFFNKLITKSLTINPTDRTFTGLLTVDVIDKDNEIIVIDDLMKVLPIWLSRGAPISDSHCYSPDTKIFTENGLKYFYELNENEKVATLNPDTHQFEWQVPTEYIENDYKGKMIKIYGQKYNFLVTPNHKMYVKHNWRKDSKFELKDAEKIYKENRMNHWRIKRNSDWVGMKLSYFEVPVAHSLKPRFEIYESMMQLHDRGASLTQIQSSLGLNDRFGEQYIYYGKKPKCYEEPRRFEINQWVKFMGWYLSEGSFRITEDGHNRIEISQEKIQNKTEIYDLVKSMGFNAFNCKQGVVFYAKNLTEYLKQFGKARNKHIPLEIKNLPQEQLRLFLDTYIKGDGNSVNKRQIITTSKKMRDDLIEISIKAGYGASWAPRMSGFTGRMDCFCVSISRKSVEPYVCGHMEEIDYEGKVYCVTVPNHVILVEREGKLSWCGNSNRIVGRGTGYRRLNMTDKDGDIHDAVEIAGFIFKDYELDHDIWDKMKSGEYTGLSFGGATKSDREPTYLPDGRIAYRLKDLEHYEAAVCALPANPLALFTSINTIAKSSKDINYTKKSDDEICIKCDNVGCYVVKSLIDVTKPFAGYKDFDACVDSNKDKGDPQAYCATIMRQVEGKNKDHPVKNQYNGSLFCLQCGEDPYSKDSKLNQDVEKGAVEDMTHDKCPHCGYIPMDGKDTVQDHMNKEHPSQTINSYNTFDSLGREPELLDGSPESYRERAGLPQPQPTQQNGNENYNRSESAPSKLPPQMEEIEKNPPTEKKKLFEYGGFSYDHYGSGRDTIRNEDQDLKPGDNTGNEDTTVTKGKIFSKKEVGYVETPVMKSCGTCEYFKSPDVCRLPLDSPVDPVDGCCNFWDQKVTIEKGEDGKAKIKLEGEPAERLLEQAGVIPEIAKGPIRTSGHKQYSDMQPQTSNISIHGSSDTVNDPNPEESPFQIGNVEENNFVAAHTTKSDSDNEALCGICGKPSDKHDRDSGHPFKGGDIIKDIQSYTKYLQKSEPEKVDVEDVINWIKVMNPSQLQHAIDPNNWYDWSETVSRLTWDEMNEDQKRLLVATYAFRNDGKVVEGIENESMIPKDEGSPQSQVDNIGKTNLHPQADTTNINATPTPMTIGQNTKNPIDPVEDERLERTQKALDSLNLTLVEIKLKKLL